METLEPWTSVPGLGPLAALQEFFDDVLAEAEGGRADWFLGRAQAKVKRLGKRPVLWEDGFDQGLRLPKDAAT